MSFISDESFTAGVAAVAKTSAFVMLSGDQSTDLLVNDAIKFNTLDAASDITFNVSTFRATLKAGKKYLLKAGAFGNFSGSTGRLDWSFYDVTNAALFGTRVITRATINTNQDTLAPLDNCVGHIEPTTDIDVEVRILAATAMTNILVVSTYWIIQEI